MNDLHVTQHGDDAGAARVLEASAAAAADELEQLRAEVDRLQAIVDGVEWAVGLAIDNTHDLNITRMADFLDGEVPKEAMVCETDDDPHPAPIPCSAHMPEEGVPALWWSAQWGWAVGVHGPTLSRTGERIGTYWEDPEGGPTWHPHPTHWMPLPPPPKV